MPAADTATVEAPFAETPPTGPVCAHCRQVHDRGRFRAGCPGPRLTTGLRSRLVKAGAVEGEGALLAAPRAELRSELGDVGLVKGSLADAFVELGAVRDYLGSRLAKEGPLTGKGRTRALLTAYLSVVDRQTKLAQLLGLERQVKSIHPLDAVRLAVEEANK